MLPWSLCFAFIISCRAAPADNPVRVDLPVYDQPKAETQVTLANPLHIENHPSPVKAKDDSILNNLFPDKSLWRNGDTSTPQVGAINYAGGLFSAPVTTLEGALLETEGFGSKTLSVKENVEGVVAGLFQRLKDSFVMSDSVSLVSGEVKAEKGALRGGMIHLAVHARNELEVVRGVQPKPIVDIIQEEEKYGNDGDKFYNAGKAIVNGASGVSNFVNSILEVPGSILSKIARAATEKLNYLGGKIVGL